MPKVLRQQIDELCSTLESVDQHVGTMLLKQRAKHQLVSHSTVKPLIKAAPFCANWNSLILLRSN